MLRLALALTTALVVSLIAAPAALADPYTQKVDNSSKRFSASKGWKTSSWSDQKAGRNYRYARPRSVADPASFKIKIPKTKRYRVFARWPATNGYNKAAAFGVRTTSGVQWQRVNQTRNGGKWVRLGTFKLRAGDAKRIYVNRRSKRDGYIIADAVRVKEVTGSTTKKRKPTRRQRVHREARSWLGVTYRYGGESRSGVDCSGLTMRVFERINMNLPRTVRAQYDRGRKTRSPRVADLAFGDYNDRRGVDHVGIYTGKGKMIHAPYPGTVVRYDPVFKKNHVGYKNIIS